MTVLRRAAVVLTCAGLLACSHNAAPAQTPDAGTEEPFHLNADSRLAPKLAAAADYIQEEDWARAVRVLQQLLDRDEDAMVEIGGEKHPRLVSARTEAERLLARLPAAGRKAYQAAQGKRGADLLTEAVKDKDETKLEEVVRRFLYTDAGPDALEALASQHYGAGRHRLAAVYYARLLGLRDAGQWTPETLFQAADAFRRTGDKARADLAGKQLLDRVGADGLRIGDKKLSRDDVQKELSKAVEANADWPVFGGDAGRSAQGDGGMPFLVPAWKQPTYLSYLPTDTKENNDKAAEIGVKITKLLDSAARQLGLVNQPMILSQFPVTATVMGKDGKEVSLVVYMTHAGIASAAGRNGKLKGRTPIKSTLDWMMQDPTRENFLNQWTQSYIQQNQRPGVLFENTTIGALCTDGPFAYVVEGLAVPPPPSSVLAESPDKPNPYGYPPEILEAISRNRLLAFDLNGGCKEVWDVPAKDDLKSELAESYFLGSPLPLDGRLFVLNEKDKELRLVCMESVQGEAPGAWKPRVVFVLPLGTVKTSLSADLSRRLHTALLSYADGVLVCPTNAGCVVGVDLTTRTIAWAHRYEEAPTRPSSPFRPAFVAPAGAGLAEAWTNLGAAVVQDGKVVTAPSDGQDLFCLDLKDGAVRWSEPRQDGDLYLAGVFDGHVLVVGKKSCRAYNLTDGKLLWTLETGVPSGRGAAAGGLYYLPLREGISTKGPEVCAIDLAKGQAVAHARSRAGEANKPEIPGNLAFFNGGVISQTATDVVVYPLLRTKLAEMDEVLAATPNDPERLLDRALLRLDGRDALGAVVDLRKALDNKPAPDLRGQARARLFDALTLLLQNDFGKGEKYLKEYEATCKEGADDAEVRRRLAGFRQLTGAGYEGQNRLTEALQAYADLAGAGDDEPLSPDGAVRLSPAVLARTRIAGLLGKATAEQRKELDEEIARRRKEAKDAAGLDPLRSFVAAFGQSTAVGREARLDLAERLLGQEGHGREAEILLAGLAREDDPGIAARAVEAQARLSVKLGLFDDALYYYGVLNRDHGAAAVRDGKTGADLYKEIMQDKRFLPYLDQPNPFEGALLKASEERDNFPYTNPAFQFGREGEALPFFRRCRLSLRFDKNELTLTDSATGEPRGKPMPIARTLFQNIATFSPFGSRTTPAFPYRTLGRLAILSVGHLVFGIDAVEGKLLWAVNLFDRASDPAAGPPVYQSLVADPRDGDLLATYPDGWVQRIGPGAQLLTPSALCLMTHDGLTALDPLTGRTLWRRDDAPAGARLFGDDDHLFVVGAEAGKPTQARVLRTADGSEVRAPDYLAAYEKRLSVVGRDLLTADSDKDGLTLRLYDTLTGKDRWKETYPAKSLPLTSLADGLAGAVDPEGKAHIIDLQLLKEVFSGAVDPKYLKDAESVYLLADGKRFFVVCNAPLPTGFSVASDLLPGTGLRDLAVNGEVCAFDAATGKMRWHFSAVKQRLLLEGFADLPVLLFAAEQIRAKEASGATQRMAVWMAERRTGKILLDAQDFAVGPFHTVEIDPARGRVEFVAPQEKIVVVAEEHK